MNLRALGYCFFTIISTFSYSQSLHADIQRIYDFSPAKVSVDTMHAKSYQMDTFWTKVNTDTALYLPQLKAELVKAGNPPLFYYDGSKLLLSINRNRSNMAVALDAFMRTNVDDVSAEDYLNAIHWLAYEDFDVTDAALKIIDAKVFQPYLVPHAMYLNKDQSLIYMLLPMKQELYLRKVIDKLKAEKGAANTCNLLNFLWYTCTCEGDAVIANYARDKKQPKIVKKYVADLLKDHVAEGINDTAHYNELIKNRTLILQSISDEALGELLSFTREIQKTYSCK